MVERAGASAAGGEDVLGRLRELQQRVSRLVTEADAPTAPASEVVPGAGTRILIVPTPPGRPELPPRRPATPAPEEAERSGPPRRVGAPDRRVAPTLVRAPAQERRSGRADRRFGHDRRLDLPRPAGRLRAVGRRLLVPTLAVLQLLGLAAAGLAVAHPG